VESRPGSLQIWLTRSLSLPTQGFLFPSRDLQRCAKCRGIPLGRNGAEFEEKNRFLFRNWAGESVNGDASKYGSSTALCVCVCEASETQRKRCYQGIRSNLFLPFVDSYLH